MKEKTPEQKKSISRGIATTAWIVLLIAVLSLQVFLIFGFYNMRSLGEDIYIMIIPIVLGVAIPVMLIGRKLKPDIYDEHKETSLAHLKKLAEEMVEIHNLFADERGGREKIRIVKE